MANEQDTKKSAIIKILQILKRYSNSKNPLTQQAILSYLKDDYDTVIDRRAVKRNIMALQEADPRVETCEKGSFYEDRELSYMDMTLIIHALRAYPGLSGKKTKNLIEVIRREMMNADFRPAVSNEGDRIVYISEENKKTAKYNAHYELSCLNESIKNEYTVNYVYTKLNGRSEEFTDVYPMKLIRTGGYYYCLGYTADKQPVSHRTDLISKIKVNDKARTRWDFGWMAKADLLPYIAASLPCDIIEKPVTIIFLTDDRGAEKVYERFGKLAALHGVDSCGEFHFEIKLIPEAAARFAMEWSDCVSVVAPASLVAVINERKKK